VTTSGSDCNDNDNTAWQSASLYVDADADGYDDGSQVVCYGTSVPSGYSVTTTEVIVMIMITRHGNPIRCTLMQMVTVMMLEHKSSAMAHPFQPDIPQSRVEVIAMMRMHRLTLVPWRLCNNAIDDNCNGQVDEGCCSSLTLLPLRLIL
jgi:hypothetical protein